jgi:hypothetical protein
MFRVSGNGENLARLRLRDWARGLIRLSNYPNSKDWHRPRQRIELPSSITTKTSIIRILRESIFN